MLYMQRKPFLLALHFALILHLKFKYQRTFYYSSKPFSILFINHCAYSMSPLHSLLCESWLVLTISLADFETTSINFVHMTNTFQSYIHCDNVSVLTWGPDTSVRQEKSPSPCCAATFWGSPLNKLCVFFILADVEGAISTLSLKAVLAEVEHSSVSWVQARW